MQKEVSQTWFFKQSPQQVWQYLTTPELLAQWLMESDFKPVPGHKFKFTHAPKNESPYLGVVDCEVIEVKPVTNLAYTWACYAKDGSRTVNSTVRWTLTEKENGTELRVLHNGFALLEDVATHSIGWGACIKRLEQAIAAAN